VLIRNAEIAGQIRDVRIAGDRIAQVAPQLTADPGSCSIDAQGCCLLPGLHDHHIHLDATAAALGSVPCGPPQIHSLEELAAVLHASPGEGWLRGIGYHDSLGFVDRAWLDRHGPDRPIRIQHRGGRMWILNSRAMAALEAVLPADGRLIDGDQVMARKIGQTAPDLAPVGAMLAARGVTGLTEVTPRNEAADLARYQAASLPQRLLVMGRASLDGLPGSGAVKLHYHDYALPELDALTREVARAHAAGRPVASHCVTRAELALTLAAIEEAGPHPGDRIEHASVAPPEMVEWIGRLGCTVVTQPHFIADRGAAYLQEVEAHDLPWLYRLRGFTDAGIRLAAGSDAPFGSTDPWHAMAAAVSRPVGLGPDEALSPEQALALYLGPLDDPGGSVRTIAPDAAADLCLIDRNWLSARQDLAAVAPLLTIAAGRVVYAQMASISPIASASEA
jgi:predicted amidohydrolase YtcJ